MEVVQHRPGLLQGALEGGGAPVAGPDEWVEVVEEVGEVG